MDTFLTYAGKPLGGLLGYVGLATNLDSGTVFLLVGALVYAVAVWRSKSRDVLREENKDVTSRNVTLEAQLGRAEERNDELASRPDVDSLAILLTKLVVSVEKHDESMKGLVTKQGDVWSEVLSQLREIRVAVVSPERVRDDE